MQVRFLTSIATDRGSFVEGQVIDVPDPAPPLVVDWLRRGIVTVEAPLLETTTLAPAAVEQAVARRGRRGRAARVAEEDD